MTAQDPVTQVVVRRLIAYREQLRLTQEALSELSGVSRTTIANIEKNRQGIPLPLLYKLCRGLGVDPASLLPSPEEVPDRVSSEVAVNGVSLELPIRVAEAISEVMNRPSRRME